MSNDTIDLVEHDPHHPVARARDVVLTAFVLVMLVMAFGLGRATDGSTAQPPAAPVPSPTAAVLNAPQTVAPTTAAQPQAVHPAPTAVHAAPGDAQDARLHGVQVRCVAHKPC